jgi:hypothetical protein
MLIFLILYFTAINNIEGQEKYTNTLKLLNLNLGGVDATITISVHEQSILQHFQCSCAPVFGRSLRLPFYLNTIYILVNIF